MDNLLTAAVIVSFAGVVWMRLRRHKAEAGKKKAAAAAPAAKKREEFPCCRFLFLPVSEDGFVSGAAERDLNLRVSHVVREFTELGGHDVTVEAHLGTGVCMAVVRCMRPETAEGE